MPADQLLALTTLAAVGSFTPGPNNTIATITAANHGLRATWPHIIGVPFGFATMLLAGSLGVAALLLATPALASLIKWAGVIYLLVIAWQVARAGVASAGGERTLPRPLTFWQSAAFQYVNPKAWMLAAATVATFLGSSVSAIDTAVVVLVYGVMAAASLILWAAVGAALRAWLAVGRRLVVFNRVMGAALAATAMWLALR